MDNQFPSNDHDLLIRIDTRQQDMIKDLRDIREGISERIKDLEMGKLDKEDAERLLKEADRIHKDHENRIRIIEKYVWIAIGGAYLLQALLAVYRTFFQ